MESKHLFTTEQAVSFIKRQPAGVKFAVHIHNEAPIDDEHCFPHGCMTYLRISRADALQLAGRALSQATEERGGRIRVSVYRSKCDGAVTVWLL